MTEEFVAALVELISKYPETIIAEALHPTSGIATKYEFLPSLAKFKEALDDAIANKHVRARVERETREQMADRALQDQIENDRKNRPTYDELMGKVPASEMIKDLDPKGTTTEHLGFAGHASDRPSYTGPIENIQPGDVIPWHRIAEYRAFMKAKKGIPNAKLWSSDEKWEDSGQRPFQIVTKPQTTPKEVKEVNPFEAL